MKLIEVRPYTPMSTFFLDAAPAVPTEGDEGYRTLTVPDCYQTVYVGESSSRPNQPWPVQSFKIAQDLYNCWVGMVPYKTLDAAPGICICEGDKPNAEELREMNRKQRNFGAILIEQANVWHRDNLGKYIQPLHRIMAAWMRVQNLPWLPEAYTGEKKPCPLCYAIIPSQASICPSCTRQIAEIPEEFARFGSPKQIVPQFPKKSEPAHV